ncbi:MAG: glycosyltransferase [bacterium]
MIISVFIINYNTGPLLKRCVESLLAAKPPHEIEIFIADNDSTDESFSIAQSIASTSSSVPIYIKKYSYNAGFVKAINPLLKLARGDYFLVVHPDIVVSSELFEEFIHFFNEHEQAGILGANLVYPDGSYNPCEIYCPGLRQYIFRLLDRILKNLRLFKPCLSEWDHKKNKQVECVWNACMIFRRQLYEEIGPFDNRYFVWVADQDFCMRARIVGWRCYYLVYPHVIHYERQISALNDFSLTKDTAYKIDGWHSIEGIIKDRYRFIYKYYKSRLLLCAIKTLDIIQQLLTIGYIVRKRNALDRRKYIRIWYKSICEIIFGIIYIERPRKLT